MFLIFGLGNPGKKYEPTRHNIGARTVRELEPLSLENAVLAGPATFINESGKAAKLLMRKYGTRTSNLIVIHDDLDIALGKIKIAKDRGAAGHKGVNSVIKELGTKNFIRIRVGIRPKIKKPENPEKFVLGKFNREEEKTVKQVVKTVKEAVGLLLKEGLEKAMNRYNE